MPLDIVCAPFHPALEEAFLEHVTAHPPGPGRRVAVVCPSRRMLDRVQRLIADERGLSLLNIRFHTFHSLALEAVEPGAEDGPRLVSDDLFHDRLIDGLLREASVAERLPRGLAGAYRETLRDLLEAGVDPEAFREHLADLLKHDDDRRQLQVLLLLQERYLDKTKTLGIMPLAGLERAAAERLEQGNDLLAHYAEVLYYGFYDLNGVQADFYSAVARARPTRVFFPYRRGHPAYRSVDRFYEVKLPVGGAKPVHPDPRAGGRALGAALDALFDPAARPAPPPKGAFRVVNASGARDEVWWTAKEILTLREDPEDPVPFDRIGVVARTLEPYRAAVADVFDEHAIPFALQSAEPLLRHPVAKLALTLLALRRRDYPADAVRDVIESPYFRTDRFRGVSEGPALTANWKKLIARTGLHSGWLQWRGKVHRWTTEDFALSPGLAAEGVAGPVVPKEDTAALWAWLEDLHRRLDPAAPARSWGDQVAHALALLQDVFDADRAAADALPRETGREERDRPEDVGAPAWAQTLAAVESLRPFSLLGSDVAWGEFLDALEERFRRAEVEAPAARRGVRVMNAMDARGESFDVLFLIGLKEGLFPRQVREDPLLKDGVRALLQQPGGHWIQPKTTGYDEEKLLFALMAGSATRRLYAVYPRSDEGGRAQVPSVYLRELARAAGVDLEGPANERVPRRPYEKLDKADPSALSPKEVSILLARDGEDAAPFFRALGRDAAPLKDGLSRVTDLRRRGEPDTLDGLVGRPEAFLRRLAAQGLSPTALDAFGACPFQFFASRVLGLRDAEEPSERGELAPWVRGTLYHLALQTFFESLRAEDFWRDPGEGWKEALERAAEKAFAATGWEETGVYPLLWESVKRRMTGHLRRRAAEDVAELRSSGFVPAFLEESFRTKAPFPLGGPLARLEFRGRPDRVDVNESAKTYRVVDYKSRWGKSKGKLADRVAGGLANQPPAYLEMLEGSGRFPPPWEPAGTFYYVLEDTPERTGAPTVQEFPGALWKHERVRFRARTAGFLHFIEQGRFFIVPNEERGGQCEYCAFATACRKSHPPSRRRAEESAWRAEYDAFKGETPPPPPGAPAAPRPRRRKT